jgi:hypothetical protein
LSSDCPVTATKGNVGESDIDNLQLIKVA